MHRQAQLYLAVHPADKTFSDVLLAQIIQTDYRCITHEDVPTILNTVTDLYGTMSESDVIILIDSDNFREQQPNRELQFAQQLDKPLIVISLDKPIHEQRSTWRVRLFDFTASKHRDWQKAVDAITELTEHVLHPPNEHFLF